MRPAIVLLVLSWLSSVQPAFAQDAVPRYRALVDDSMPCRGPDDALVTVVMWSDFQCPFCARVGPTLDRLREQYGDDLRIVWRDMPLPFHERADEAAEAAREAFAQLGDRGFWAMHDLLFAHQDALTDADLETYAQTIGLNLRRFRRAMAERTHRASTEAGARAAAEAGVSGTPSFFVNGRPLVGAQPYERFAEVIDDELARARASLAADGPRGRRAGYYERVLRDAVETPVREPEAAPTPARVLDEDALYRVPVAGAPSRGAADALVTIVAFSDFECPFCARAVATMARLAATYGPDVRLVFRHRPLPFHEHARLAAEAAMEAFAQRGDAGFWAMHDLLFENQRSLERADLERLAGLAGLDLRRFRAALDAHTHAPAIEADLALAESLGVVGTPYFYVNGRLVRGAQPFETFRAAVDTSLAEARALLGGGTPRAAIYDAVTGRGSTTAVWTAAPDEEEEADVVYDLPVPSRAPSRGSPTARVVVQIFSDFQCPFCARVEPTLDALVARFGDRVRFVWRNYPLPFHDHARAAAAAAMEAFAQRGDAGFWAMHHLLFEHQRELERADLERYAALVGLDLGRFRSALDRGTHDAAIDADIAAVREAGASIGTPSFFIAGRLVQGAQPLEVFVAEIERALAEVR